MKHITVFSILISHLKLTILSYVLFCSKKRSQTAEKTSWSSKALRLNISVQMCVSGKPPPCPQDMMDFSKLPGPCHGCTMLALPDSLRETFVPCQEKQKPWRLAGVQSVVRWFLSNAGAVNQGDELCLYVGRGRRFWVTAPLVLVISAIWNKICIGAHNAQIKYNHN